MNLNPMNAITLKELLFQTARQTEVTWHKVILNKRKIVVTLQ